MSVSYRLSQEHNFQTVLWACCRLSVGVVRKSSALFRAALPWLLDLEALLMGAIAVLTFGLGLFAVVAAIPVQFWAGLLVVGVRLGHVPTGEGAAMKALLILSLCCLPTPAFGVGVAGLVAWGLLSLLFTVAGGGVEQMSDEIQSGNTGAGGCWLWLVAAFVVVGGAAVLLSFFSVAAELRGVTP